MLRLCRDERVHMLDFLHGLLSGAMSRCLVTHSWGSRWRASQLSPAKPLGSPSAWRRSWMAARRRMIIFSRDRISNIFSGDLPVGAVMGLDQSQEPGEPGRPGPLSFVPGAHVYEDRPRGHASACPATSRHKGPATCRDTIFMRTTPLLYPQPQCGPFKALACKPGLSSELRSRDEDRARLRAAAGATARHRRPKPCQWSD
jgi:hypothetical protein